MLKNAVYIHLISNFRQMHKIRVRDWLYRSRDFGLSVTSFTSNFKMFQFYTVLNGERISKKLTFWTVVLRRSECQRTTVRNVSFLTLFLHSLRCKIKNLTTCKTVSIETPTQHFIYLSLTGLSKFNVNLCFLAYVTQWLENVN